MFAPRPETKGDKYADRLNGMKNFVASRTLKKMAWNASLIKGDVATELAKIKQQPGGNIVKYGITNLDRTLLAAGLVDGCVAAIKVRNVLPHPRVFPKNNAVASL